MVDVQEVLDIAIKGVETVEMLVEAEHDAQPAIESITRLLKGAKAGTVTPAQLETEEDLLDELIGDFNAPLV